MNIQLNEIPLRSILHFLGWRGTSLDAEWTDTIQELSEQVKKELHPQAILRRFSIERDGSLGGTIFQPRGKDITSLLSGCKEAALLAATLGADSERLLLRAETPQKALLLDAMFSAAIEAVCDQVENDFRAKMKNLYVTDRFSPGYGDMPLEQSREICEVLSANRTIGLSVTASGIMIPRKSVTAIMGISDKPVFCRTKRCQNCRMNCPMREE